MSVSTPQAMTDHWDNETVAYSSMFTTPGTGRTTDVPHCWNNSEPPQYWNNSEPPQYWNNSRPHHKNRTIANHPNTGTTACHPQCWNSTTPPILEQHTTRSLEQQRTIFGVLATTSILALILLNHDFIELIYTAQFWCTSNGGNLHRPASCVQQTQKCIG